MVRVIGSAEYSNSDAPYIQTILPEGKICLSNI